MEVWKSWPSCVLSDAMSEQFEYLRTVWFRVMVGTTMYTGDVWSSLDLLSSEIQNFLVTMSLPRYTTELTHWKLKKDAMSANLKKKNLYSKIGLIH